MQKIGDYNFLDPIEAYTPMYIPRIIAYPDPGAKRRIKLRMQSVYLIGPKGYCSHVFLINDKNGYL